MGAGASTTEKKHCALAFKLAKKGVRDGIGEGQPAHGFVIIMAHAAAIFAMKENGKPKLGKIMNPALYDYRDKNFNLNDADRCRVPPDMSCCASLRSTML